MGKEIERKFLVKKEVWDSIEKQQTAFIRQGYLSTDPYKTIRVRLMDTQAYLTIKGITEGATRTEFEYEIPIEEAEELLNSFTVSNLSKIRHTILFKNMFWEVDEFLGDNLGLIVAEIELKSESEQFELPAWIDREVTTDVSYYNSNLSTHPFSGW